MLLAAPAAMTMRRTALLTSACVLGALGAPAASPAATTGSATATCGTTAVGGGVRAEARAANTRVEVSGPAGAAGWFGQVGNDSGVDQRFQTYALCSTLFAPATTAKAAFAVAPGAVGEGSAVCPPNQVVTGGGITSTTDASGSVLQASAPIGPSGQAATTLENAAATRWFASVRNGGPLSRTYEVHAQCVVPNADYPVVVWGGTITTGAGQVGESIAPCQSSHPWATGGGVVTTSATVNNTIQSSGPFHAGSVFDPVPAGAPATGWYARVHNVADLARQYRIFALCEPRANVVTTAQTTFVVRGTGPGGGAGGSGGGGGATGPGTGSAPTGPGASTKAAVFCNFRRATLVGNARNNVLRGTPGRDVIAGLGGNDVLYGLGGDDILCGGQGIDRVYGGSGKDVARGGGGNDRVYGDGGSDSLFGGDGNDRLFGGLGDDRLSGEKGVDRLLGNAGRDRLLGGLGADTLNGGPGRDVLAGGAGRDVQKQ